MNRQDYIETAVLGADRIELIRMLYRGAIAAIQTARQNLANGEIAARAKSISKAMDIITELTLSLDLQAGGVLAGNLADLYAYIQQLLIKGHAKQSDSELMESENLLKTLLSGWSQISADAIAQEGTPEQSSSTSPVLPTAGLHELDRALAAAAEEEQQEPAVMNPFAAEAPAQAHRSWEL